MWASEARAAPTGRAGTWARSTMSMVLLAHLASMLSASQRTAEHRSSNCRCTDPNAQCWPSAGLWAELNSTVGGRLLGGGSPSSPVSSPVDACTTGSGGEDTACTLALNRSELTEFWTQKFPAGSITTGFMGSGALVPSEYAVAAASPADIAAAVRFANFANLRLMVKGTGHDFFGRGNARHTGSLLLWTHRMQSVSWSSDNQTVTVAAGVRWEDVYMQGQERGKFVLGGHCDSVGAAGGFVLAGGWGPFSRRFGTAADNVLSVRVVTADGRIRELHQSTASGAEADLLWALRGGGGGTFGVIASVTYRAWPMPATAGVTSGAISCRDDASAARMIESFVPILRDQLLTPAWGCSLSIERTGISLGGLCWNGIAAKEAEAVLALVGAAAAAIENCTATGLAATAMPVLTDALSGASFVKMYPNIDNGVYPQTGDPEVDSHWIMEPGVGYRIGFISRYVPLSLLADPVAARKTFFKMFEENVSVGLDLKKATGVYGKPPDPAVFGGSNKTSYNPASREAAALILPSVVAGEYYPALPESSTMLRHLLKSQTAYASKIGCTASAVANMSAAEMGRCWTAFKQTMQANRDDFYARVAPTIRAAFPAASYPNECDYFEAEWQTVFWGPHYPRLRAIKDAVDPAGLFVCHHCVGSELWTADGNCLNMIAAAAPPPSILPHSLAAYSNLIAVKQADVVTASCLNQTDCTAELQAALDSCARIVKVPALPQGRSWVVRQISVTCDGQTIELAAAAVLQAKRGEFHKGEAMRLFVIENRTDVTVLGNGAAVFRMWRSDYGDAELYNHSEGRHGIAILGSKNIVLDGLTVTETGGDGVYISNMLGLSTGQRGTPNYNITVTSCNLTGNYRNAISVISVKGLRVENAILALSKGTPPQGGIGFEPNFCTDLLQGIVLENVTVFGNAQRSITLSGHSLRSNSSYEPIDILISNSRIESGGSLGISINTSPSGVPVGSTLDIREVTVSDTAGAGLLLEDKHANLATTISNSIFKNVATAGGHPFWIEGRNAACDGTQFSNVTIIDHQDRAPVSFMTGVKDMAGEITVQSPQCTEVAPPGNSLVIACALDDSRFAAWRDGSAQGPSVSFGPPQTFEGYGGKMSNTLDLYPDGFASGRNNRPVSSTTGGKTFQNVASNATFFSDFAFHTDAKGHRVAQDFGTGLVYVHSPNVTSVTFNATSIWRFRGENLTWQNGPDVVFRGLPHEVCGHGTNDWISPHASGHIEHADGTHLHSTIIEWCDAPYPYGVTSLVAFQSSNGIEYEYVGNVITSLDVPASSEGPNEHDMALLGNGDVLCVTRMGAGDGGGGYMPLYKTLSKDFGKTWSTAEAMPGIGCARPHLVQLDDNITLLSAGRSMMKGAYSRSFSVWASTDLGVTWVRSDGSYHHNHKANITGAPLWPASCNKTGWRFEFTSGYVGLVRVGPRSAMVLYDFMPPVASPPSPPPAPGQCKIRIHHTIGCYNDSDWQSGTKGLLLPAYQASVHGKTSLQTCASACHAAKLTVAGINAGSDCFCGAAADLNTPIAMARNRPKAECMASVCDADPTEKDCGGPGRLLAYQFTCDPAAEEIDNVPDTLFDQHNPPYSFAMRIDVPLKSDDKFKLGNTSVSAVWGGHSGAPPPPPPSILPHSLAAYPGAVCIDGRPGTVYANASTTASTTWVIQLGPGNGGAGMFCWMDPSGKPTGQLWDCSTAAKPKTAPPPPGPAALGAAGPQDLNCTRNPDFCTANQARIEMCSMDLLLGDRTIPNVNGTNGTTLNFKGRALLAASLTELGKLGLNKATHVVLTGETHAGTAALLVADEMARQLKLISPGLKVFKVLPADGMHPRFDSMFAQSLPGLTTLWMDQALQSMAALANVTGALNQDCVAANLPNESYKCLYFAEALSHVKTPTFAVQQIPGTWDYQCLYDGRLRPYLECSSHSTYFREQYMCVQYPDLCGSQLVRNFSVPLQKKYIADYKAGGGDTRPGMGGFFFSCFLGSYWEMLYDDAMLGPHTGTPQPHSLDAVWNQIAIGGTTMRQAISSWWKSDPAAAAADAGSFFHEDCLWDPDGKPPHADGKEDAAAAAAMASRAVATAGSGRAPPVPFYTSRFFCNPTCRGYPWY